MFFKKNNPYLSILIIYIVIGAFLYWYFPNFAGSNFFVGTVTFLVGSLALYIYKKQKNDEKANAATTLLLEIRNAEGKIDIIIDKLDKNNAVDLPRVLPINSWRIYSHLFVKDFDLDAIQLLNDFYSSCEIIEDLSSRQNNFVWITTEERAKAVQNKLAEIHDDFQIESISNTLEVQKKAGTKFTNRKAALGDYYVNENLSYAPDKILKGLKFQTDTIKRVTSTSSGTKLKEMASIS